MAGRRCMTAWCRRRRLGCRDVVCGRERTEDSAVVRGRTRPSMPGRRGKDISGPGIGHVHRHGRRCTGISERGSGPVPTGRRCARVAADVPVSAIGTAAWREASGGAVWVPTAYGRKQVASRLNWHGDHRRHGVERPVADTEEVRSAAIRVFPVSGRIPSIPVQSPGTAHALLA
jgi:hypothetical protein